jgi:hypothetical protein
MPGFGKTTIFNGLLGNRPDVFCWASDYLIWSSFSRIWRLGDRPFQEKVMVRTSFAEKKQNKKSD